MIKVPLRLPDKHIRRALFLKSPWILARGPLAATLVPFFSVQNTARFPRVSVRCAVLMDSASWTIIIICLKKHKKGDHP
ncbi:MAG: hypothetical protein JW843_09975 [Candidatus Aminicenantes bacterium]|nr:hypothetical protein [Candidatus Aminicenantes bacterium]